MLQRYSPGKFLLSQRPGSASKEGKRATRCFTWVPAADAGGGGSSACCREEQQHLDQICRLRKSLPASKICPTMQLLSGEVMGPLSWETFKEG